MFIEMELRRLQLSCALTRNLLLHHLVTSQRLDLTSDIRYLEVAVDR